MEKKNLPTAFMDEIHRLLGSEEGEQMLRAITDSCPPTSVRLNEAHLTGGSISLPFPTDGEAVPWCSSGRYLAERPAFTFDPLLHAGAYYVQEASSMFVEQAVRRYVGPEPLVALDLCAAPGGKSTLLRSLLPDGSLLVANEVVRTRAQILTENLTKWGHPDVVVTSNAPADYTPLGPLFDLVLADVPCSGEGMFRKDAGAVEEWSPANVEQCRLRQRDILQDIWPCLKPGGLFIYSTCTYNIKEDEENVCWVADELGAEVLPLDVPQEWGVTGSLLPGRPLPVYRFLPHKSRGEGFFMAVLRKEADGDVSSTARLRKSRRSSGKEKPLWNREQEAQMRGWLHAPEAYSLLTVGPQICAIPTLHTDLCRLLLSSVRVLQAGVPLAEPKGHDLVPCHALALSLALHPDAFPRVELSYDEAISYLRRESVNFSSGEKKGFLLVTYQSLPLGFVKHLGTRTNNLYPSEWRIRSAING